MATVRMRKLCHIRWPVLVSLAWLLSSCSSVAPQQNAGEVHPRFHDGATTDMILRFFTWDSIYMTRPDTRENGFLPLYARDDIGREVKRRNINRNTAAVVVSLFYRDPVQLAQLSLAWTTYLNEQGFRRVVILHAGPGKDIDGLPVLSDSITASITDAHDEPTKVAFAPAAVPAPAGANVVNPSSSSIR